MTFRQIAQQRLQSQQIAGTELGTPAEIVSHMGAMQAQEYAQAKWAIGLRLPGITEKEVEAELTAGRILRTHLLRPTWHFVAAGDIRWMLRLTAPRVHAVNAFMYRKMELDAGIFKQCHKIIARALAGGQELTRNAFSQLLQHHKIPTDTVRLSCIMMHAELEGLICSGARQGNQFTYALLEERVPETTAKTRDEALYELSRRYIAGRGPATVPDFAAWSGLTLADCRKGISMIGAGLEKRDLDGICYYAAAGDSLQRKTFNALCLLPIYDELIMGYRDRSPVLQHSKALANGEAFVFDNTLLHKGQIVGTWKRTIRSGDITLRYHFLTSPDNTTLRALEKAIAKLEAFSGLPVKAAAG